MKNLYKIFFLFGLLLVSSSAYAQDASTTPDTTAPVISDVTLVPVPSDGINIFWVTDEPAIFAFKYGTNQNYALTESLTNTLSASGTVNVSNLLPDTTYYYCITATDTANNASNYCDTFITSPAPDTTGSIISGIANEYLLSTSTKIVWITDEPAFSKLRYGTTSNLGRVTDLETTTSLQHDVTLTGLTPNTKYYFCIDATDISGNNSDSCGHSFITATTIMLVDTVPPIISSLTASSITATSSKITWTTNEESRVQVQYGLTLNYGTLTSLSRYYTLDHTIRLYQLTPGTLYHYRARSVDRTGNVSLSPDETFTTDNLPTPLIPDPSYVDGASESGALRTETIISYRNESGVTSAINNLSSIANPIVIMPVLFGVGINNISPNFGDPRSGGRTHEGEDIMAVKGTPIVSPTDAVVIRTGVGATEGNYVYTANPGRETFVYMHLDRIGEGVTRGTILHAGSLIGYVGNTGNAAGGPAHLHFEIHNPSGVPVDPFPRLTGEFTIEQKISFLNTIMTQTSDPANLAQFLVINFRSTFNAALSRGITLPPLIVSYLASLPDVPPPSISGGLPYGDLALGSSGSLVITLQKYLIAKNIGPAAQRLASAGATGYFGAITQTALIEFQKAYGISATGYYGPITQSVVTANPVGSAVPTTPVSSGTTSSTTQFTRNLYLGISGEDVRSLQKLLNRLGITVALTGPGSVGNESTYFGRATQTAVIKFQLAHKISPAYGYVGPLTRAVLNTLI